MFDHKEATFGIGEVKCPFSKKDFTIEEASKDKQFFLQNTNGKIQLKKLIITFIKFKDAWHHLMLVGVILWYSQMLTYL